MLLEAGAAVSPCARDGWTPLHQAALSGKEDVVRSLLAWGAPVKPEGKGGVTPMHLAVFNNRKKVS